MRSGRRRGKNAGHFLAYIEENGPTCLEDAPRIYLPPHALFSSSGDRRSSYLFIYDFTAPIGICLEGEREPIFVARQKMGHRFDFAAGILLLSRYA